MNKNEANPVDREKTLDDLLVKNKILIKSVWLLVRLL